MNKLLEKAIAEISRLPDEDQEVFAAQILAEIEDEQEWNKRFANSPDKLMRLACQAHTSVAKGAALPYDPSNMPSS